MADQPPSSQTVIGRFTLSSLLTSPTFKLFTSKLTPFDSDFGLISPTSILHASPSICSLKHDHPTIPKPQRFQPPVAVGLADLVKTDHSTDTDTGNVRNSKMVLFGSKLRVQIPSADFGTKSGGERYPEQGQSNGCVQTRVLSGCKCIEVWEEYTCVTSHGPNPSTRHILENCVFVESVVQEAKNSMKMESFLKWCYTCKKNLDQKDDIYIYRGEKGFCSRECRYKEMLIDDIDIESYSYSF